MDSLLDWQYCVRIPQGAVTCSIGQDWRRRPFVAYDCPARCARRIRLVAYGARLESVLGASPRGFESPILRHRTPGPVEVPGFLLPVASLVFRAPSGPAAVCAGGRRPAREPSALRASLGASSRSPARPRRRPPAPRQVPPAPSTPAALVSLGLARPGPAAAHRHRGQALQTSGALHAGGTCGAVCTGR